jgi:hypothetical protein
VKIIESGVDGMFTHRFYSPGAAVTGSKNRKAKNHMNPVFSIYEGKQHLSFAVVYVCFLQIAAAIPFKNQGV